MLPIVFKVGKKKKNLPGFKKALHAVTALSDKNGRCNVKFSRSHLKKAKKKKQKTNPHEMNFIFSKP